MFLPFLGEELTPIEVKFLFIIFSISVSKLIFFKIALLISPSVIVPNNFLPSHTKQICSFESARFSIASFIEFFFFKIDFVKNFFFHYYLKS